MLPQFLLQGPTVCVLMTKPSKEFWYTLICKNQWANCFTKYAESQSRDSNEHAITREFVKCYRLKKEAMSDHVSYVHSYLTKLGKLWQRRSEAVGFKKVTKLRLMIFKLDFLPLNNAQQIKARSFCEWSFNWGSEGGQSQNVPHAVRGACWDLEFTVYFRSPHTLWLRPWDQWGPTQ